jgi:hypothetical protein
LQAVVQGVLTAIISLLLYGRAVSILGASSGAAFAATCIVAVSRGATLASSTRPFRLGKFGVSIMMARTSQRTKCAFAEG